MHENSQTIERDGKFYNVNGVTGVPLTPRFPFESLIYHSLKAALFAANQRSKWEGVLAPQDFSPATQIEAAAMRALMELKSAHKATK